MRSGDSGARGESPSVITMGTGSEMLQGMDQSGSHTYNTGVSIKHINSVKDQLTISGDNCKNTLYLIIVSLKVYDTTKYYCVKIHIEVNKYEPRQKPPCRESL